MKDKELVKMFNPTLKMREAILFFLIVVINGLKCIVSDIRLNTCAGGGEEWRYQNWFTKNSKYNIYIQLLIKSYMKIILKIYVYLVSKKDIYLSYFIYIYKNIFSTPIKMPTKQETLLLIHVFHFFFKENYDTRPKKASLHT